MLTNAVALALLNEDAVEPSTKRFRQRHVGEPGLRIADREQASQLAPRLSERHGLRAGRGLDGLGPSLHLINKFAQFLGKLAVTAPGSLSRDLHGDGVE